MSLQTFLNLYQGLTRVVNELETKGIITRNPEAVTDVQPTAVATSGKKK